MLLLIWLGFYIEVVNCEVCSEFIFDSSHYIITSVLVQHTTELKSLNELKKECIEGYRPVSITSNEENMKITDALRANCSAGVSKYAIGLSRVNGGDRFDNSNWEWESNETIGMIFWAAGEPNSNAESCAYIDIQVQSFYNWMDDECRLSPSQTNGNGYICEKAISTVTTSTPTVTVTTKSKKTVMPSILTEESEHSVDQQTPVCDEAGTSDINFIEVVIILASFNVIFIAIILIGIHRYKIKVNTPANKTPPDGHHGVEQNVFYENFQVEKTVDEYAEIS